MLPARGDDAPLKVLEIASGTGEHAAYFARHLSGVDWQPSDVDDGALASIDAWVIESDLPNLRRPLRVDVTVEPKELRPYDAVVCINMLHIAPWAATEALIARASRCLPAGGPLIIYGPMLHPGVETAASNIAFDQSLRARSAAWGLRTLTDIEALASQHGFGAAQVTEMPANNVTVVFYKS